MSEPLDSRQLNAFATLARTGSYTETARRLHVTHSAISHAMRALEASAGCRLLSRMGKKVILTDAGEALLQHAEQVLSMLKKARQTLDELNNWGCTRLRLAADAALGEYFLTKAITNFHQESARTFLNIEFFSSCDSEGLLSTNRADLVFTEKPAPDERFDFIPLFADRFQLVANPAHPWVARGEVAREELPKEPFVLQRSSQQTKRMFDDYLNRQGITLNIVAEVDSVELAKELVKQTSAVSILPVWAVKRETKSGSLALLPFGRKVLDQTWGVVHRKDHPLNHGESTFLKLCGNQLGHSH